MTPPSPVATFATMCGSGRLAITVSTRSATSCGDDASLRAERNQRRDGIVARVVDDEFVAGLDQPARHRLPHIAEADEADFHDVTSRNDKCEAPTLPAPQHRVIRKAADARPGLQI